MFESVAANAAVDSDFFPEFWSFSFAANQYLVRKL